MTQKEKIQKAILLANKIKYIASEIKSEGDDYDMTWHKRYCKELEEASSDFLKAIKK